MIGFVSDIIYSLQSKSVRLQAADVLPEHTWIGHALLTVLLGGGIGAVIGFVIGASAFGFRVGLLVAWLCYLYREVNQWRGPRAKPEQWWWDATLDVLFPLWVISPFLLGAVAFYILTLAVAVFHLLLRPVE